MGYKPFNKTTIQLPLPSSTLTKAQYKEAYGIDLDNIDIEKVTLVQEEGSKNKYFVDEIKATEEGFDIYAGGKILSIGASVSVIDNAYSVENAKPIYCHPLTFVGTSDNKLRLAALIFNNSSTPFTVSAFIDFVDELYTSVGENVRILVSGAYITSDGPMVASYIGRSSAGFFVAGNLISDLSEKSDIYSTKALFSTLFTNLYDGVNKIN